MARLPPLRVIEMDYSEPARNFGMELRQRADAILVGLIPFSR